MSKLKNYDCVVYIGPEGIHKNISPGDIGYIIEIFNDSAVEVEFSDGKGITYALDVIDPRHLIRNDDSI